ncbi:hypothetical protein [Treponema sp.]|uniref:hypothetical protein n=1 Tax=Treponema sp. TaxID=166 RepID=UPI00388EB3E1
MNDSNNVMAVLQILTIIANFIIAFIAIFGEKIRNIFYKPELDISITALFPDCNLTSFSSGQRAFFFRLAVVNTGSVDANNVQVYLNNVKIKGLDGNYSICNNVLPMNLMWSYQDNEPIKTSIAQVISPGMKKYCDFIYTVENSNCCTLCTEIPLFSYGIPSNYIARGDYIANIIVFASNSKPKSFDIQFEYKGFWSDNAKDIIEIKS